MSGAPLAAQSHSAGAGGLCLFLGQQPLVAATHLLNRSRRLTLRCDPPTNQPTNQPINRPTARPPHPARYLKELGVEAEQVNFDLKAKEHKSADFLKVNPFGKVPAMSDGEFNLVSGGGGQNGRQGWLVHALLLVYTSRAGSCTPAQSHARMPIIPPPRPPHPRPPSLRAAPCCSTWPTSTP